MRIDLKLSNACFLMKIYVKECEIHHRKLQKIKLPLICNCHVSISNIFMVFITSITSIIIMSIFLVVLRNGIWTKVRWLDVIVGDLVKVISGQFFPADMILLSSRYSTGTMNSVSLAFCGKGLI